MPRGRKSSLTIRLPHTERQTLLTWQRSTTIRAGLARRGRIILLVAEGMSISAIAATVGISRRFVYKWAQRFLEHGIEGLSDKPGRGSQRVFPSEIVVKSHKARALGDSHPSRNGRW